MFVLNVHNQKNPAKAGFLYQNDHLNIISIKSSFWTAENFLLEWCRYTHQQPHHNHYHRFHSNDVI